jgi:uncharacterized protein YjaG (DUF416 family)
MVDAIRFDRAALQSKLALLDPRRQVAFAALCAERLLPYYRWFSAGEHWGDFAALRRSLDVVWDYVRGDDIAPGQLEALRQLSESLAPDTEDFSSPLASRAMDSATAVALSLGLCTAPSAQITADVAEIASEAAFGTEQSQLIDNLDQPRIADRAQLKGLLRGPRVVEEIEMQQKSLEALKRSSKTSPDLDDLRRRFGSPS